ncbi:hypothetical protein TL16_g13258 [Triparma laevis f. inornata]|uniref:Non-canonical E2 ubiquitin-conjugating enzyme C-terminal domain-containing protein n=1 Tax=Triparma laevis f. inornata TaxID=1714386 RepID=A0A9W7C0X6_9STRA|nr:hypothetical protein TL16_g13258 [Triparma laevis f. inornata]
MSNPAQAFDYPLPSHLLVPSSPTFPQMFTHLLSNSITSLDSLYFTIGSRKFKSSRETVFINLSPTNVLTVFDFGAGLTRPDIVNSLCSLNEEGRVGGFWSCCSSSTKVTVQSKSLYDEFYTFTYTQGSSQVQISEGCSAEFEKLITIKGCGCKVEMELEGTQESDWMEGVKESIKEVMEKNKYSVAFGFEDLPSFEEEEEDSDNEVDESDLKGDPGSLHKSSVLSRSKFIPLRLSLAERKMLRLVESAMKCSEYTTNVDSGKFKNAAKRTHKMLQGITGVLHGLVMSCNYEAGQKLAEEKDFAHYENYFQSQFEIARRHKVMNPEKMRAEYGKLVYLMADAMKPEVADSLGFDVKGDLMTVYKFLEEKGETDLLEDKYIEVATEEILADKGKSRAEIQQQIKRKEKAVKYIKEKYSNHNLDSEEIHLCLYSICDNNSFLNSNRLPVDKMITYLREYFSPTAIKTGYSLAIVSGEDGARLSHSHERQYYFALQSLTLWRDILDDMFRLWALAEDDLLSSTIQYSLKDTGQGQQRVQQSPKTYRAMQALLQRVQSSVDTWIGSSMIHLGDHNVPNALNFIDKYTQVPRILGPIVVCLENLEKMVDADDNLEAFIDKSFGGLETLKRDILYDFFKSAFDGSGATNFYDAGSCIDGRLTSAWNWCQSLPEKEFYCIFKLTGFTGFDGDFR